MPLKFNAGAAVAGNEKEYVEPLVPGDRLSSMARSARAKRAQLT
jgi:hypothetical protein